MICTVIRMKRATLAIVLTALLPCLGALAAAPATRPSTLAVVDDHGVSQHPLDLHNSAAAVIIFVGIDCPISNAYAPQINRLCEQYQAKKVAFFLVHCDADVTNEAAAKHAKDFGYTCPILIDRKHQLAHQLGATVTPEAAVIAHDGKLLYRGRIDDWFMSLGKQRKEPTTHELGDAIEAAIAGKDVAAPRTQAIGCSIAD
jgi:thiol-disulfide isomerase/thioredoxin